ncbi:MAG: hypothetical protein LBR95_04420 [Azoarcus sp.]|jgi:hypothetical protein|nr:hypothetical protein [Azoarcus sp.]
MAPMVEVAMKHGKAQVVTVVIGVVVCEQRPKSNDYCIDVFKSFIYVINTIYKSIQGEHHYRTEQDAPFHRESGGSKSKGEDDDRHGIAPRTARMGDA